MSSLEHLNKDIVSCQKCPRLMNWCQTIAKKKRKMYLQDTYWGKPVPSFGDPKAQILIVGLAPAAHGANRTGRMFTGDRSGLWLYRAIHKAGLSNQFSYERADDGLILENVWITAMVHCAPPQNKPTTEEKAACFEYFQKELQFLTHVKVIIALGSIGWDGIYKTLRNLTPGNSPGEKGKKPKFGHGATFAWGPYTVIGSYHPSQQNTFTGRLTEPMLDDIFKQAKSCL